MKKKLILVLVMLIFNSFAFMACATNNSSDQTQKADVGLSPATEETANVYALLSDEDAANIEVLSSDEETPNIDMPSIPDELQILAMSASLNSVLAILEDGSLWMWGENQLPGFLPDFWIYMPLVGDGTTEARTTPIAIMDNVVSITQIADTIFAFDEKSVLWAWGSNNIGQLGDGTTKPRLSPVVIMDNVKEISAHYFMDHGRVGYMNTFVLTNDGQLWRIGSLRGLSSSDTDLDRIGILPMRLHL